MAAASSAQVSANAAADAGRSERQNEYAAPPAPIPSSAMASTSPNMKVVPPSSGVSIRYQTISIRRNAKPATAEAPKTNRGGTGPRAPPVRARTAGSPGGVSFRAAARARTPTRRLTSAAISRVLRLPNVSTSQKVESRAPATAPTVFAAYSRATRRRLTSSPVSIARAAAGSVPPMRNVGVPMTTAARARRSTDAPPSPRTAEPPSAM